MLDRLQSILDAPCFNEPWKPVSLPALVAWLIFYVAFLAYAFSAHGGYLFIDNQPHRPRGRTICSAGRPHARPLGGTPCSGWSHSCWRLLFNERQTTGFVFCLFFFFENCPTATYMAVRAQVPPLVTTGDRTLWSDFTPSLRAGEF
jgi:hypothetical protein